MAHPIRQAALSWLLALALGMAVSPAVADPYSVEDMLQSESFGAASVDPAERWIVFERRGPYASAARFDLVINSPWTVSALWVEDVERPGAPRRLLAESEGLGHLLGAWSPSGRRLLIYRLSEDQWEAGVVEMDTRAVRWLGLTPELGVFGRIAQWRSDDELLLVVRPDRSLPRLLVHANRAQDALRARWTGTAIGQEVQATHQGSGAFAETARPDPVNAIVRIFLGEGRVETLVRGDVTDLELSPDHRHVAAIDNGGPAGFDPTADFEPQTISVTRRLTLIDLASGRIQRPCETCDVAPNLLTWSPDSRRLLVWARQDEDWIKGDLMSVDVATGRIDAVARHGLEPYTGGGVAAFNTVYGDWQGDRPLLFARASPQDRYDWFRLDPQVPVNLTASLAAPTARLGAIDGSDLLLLSNGSAWRVDRRGSSRRLSDATGLKPFAAFGGMASTRRTLNSPPRDGWMPTETALGRIDRPGASRPRREIPGPPSADLLAPVFASRHIEIRREVRNGVQDLIWTEEQGPDHPLATINTHLARVEFARPVAVTHPGPDGKTLTSWLYMPPKAGPGRTPLVVLSYPGGGGAGPLREPAAFNSWANGELVAAAGYGVLVPNLPPRRWPLEPADGYVDDIDRILDAALAQNPQTDPDRVGHWGHSFGGYASLVAATRSRRYRSIIAVSGVSDMVTMWGQFSPDNAVNGEVGVSIRQRAGWAERSQGAMGEPPWIDPDRYIRNSPLFEADRIQAPVLLIHGDRDLLPMAQSEMMFSALWRQNKDARLVTYWGENHHLWSPANIRDLYGEIVRWLDQTLSSPEVRPAAPPSGGPSSR